ncbi:MAG: RluA family pseudouridine synthase [Lactobacillaceae bacterium]|jgi:23S rRNA pseudouridine1911/1915/1917 synthase|nr:RluA family pseudouridine synthase [Lactobacillaceae bacterium]
MNIAESNIFLSPVVSAEEKGERLDKFLSNVLPDMSRSQIQRLIVSGYVTSDDMTIADNSFKVKEGDSYQVFVPEAEEAVPEPENIPLDVVYEDEDLIVVNKPAGMTVHPAPGVYKGTLVNALLYHCKDLSGIGGVKRPGIVHRIDKDTSGLLVVAKNDFAHRALSEQFFDHSVERTYWAIVYGVPSPMSGRIEGNIGRSSYDRKKMAVINNGGKRAVTNYKTLKMFGQLASLVECKLETGRTHQIRVHLSSIGCNLIGDKVYEKSKKTSLRYKNEEQKHYIVFFPRQALHAKTLGFIHPRTKKSVSYSADFPEDLLELEEALI